MGCLAVDTVLWITLFPVELVLQGHLKAWNLLLYEGNGIIVPQGCLGKNCYQLKNGIVVVVG